MKTDPDSSSFSRHGASLQVDRLQFTISEDELISLKAAVDSNQAEEAALKMLSKAITCSLGGNGSASVSRLAGTYVLNIVQQHSRLSEMLSREVSDWIKEIRNHGTCDRRSFQIILPHSIMVNAGQDLRSIA